MASRSLSACPRRSLRTPSVRTTDIAGYHGWQHLRQAWLVRQETLNKKGDVLTTIDRYYVSNLPGNRLTPKQTLLLVRNHWGIENDTFNSYRVRIRLDLKTS